MVKAFSYVRFSSGRQAEGDSERRQIALAEKYAADHGLELDTTFRDLGVSGFRGSNRTKGALARFIEAAGTPMVPVGSYFLIEDFDRFSREPVATALSTFLKLIEAGITLVTLMDQKVYSSDTLDDWTILITTLNSMSTAHKESAKKHTRILEKWDQRRLQGKRVDGLKPAWIDIENGKFVINSGRQAILIRIFTEAANGIGADKIARRLNADAIASWGAVRKDGSLPSWGGTYIQNILKGRSVLGELQHHKRDGNRRVPIGDPVVGYYPPTITHELYHAAKAGLAGRSWSNGRGRKGEFVTNLFRGVALCGTCGGNMRVKTNGRKRYQYLLCANAARGMCETVRHHRYPEFEDQFLSLVTEVDLGGGNSDDSSIKAKIGETNHELEIQRGRSENIAELMIATSNPKFNEKLVEAQVEEERLIKALEILEKELLIIQTMVAPNAHQEGLNDLRRKMADKNADLYSIRSKVALSIRAVTRRVEIRESGEAIATLSDGAVYRFLIADPRERFTLVRGSTHIEGGIIVDDADAASFKEILLKTA